MSIRKTPGQLLAVYSEPLARERRIALFGLVDSLLVETVLEFEPRLVHVYHPPLQPGERVLLESPRVTNSLLRAGDLGVRESSFDLALVPDLALLGDPESVLKQVRRAIGTTGVAIVACRNLDATSCWLDAPLSPDPPSYTEFYDLCTLHFSEVRLLGAAPFAGYSVAEFAPERDPEIAFDASLVTSPETPEWFIAVVSERPDRALEAYQIIQISTEIFDSDEAPRIEEQSILSRSSELTSVIAETERKLHEAEARAGDQFVRAERLQEELQAGGDELRSQRERVARLGREVEDERRGRLRFEEQLAAAQKRPHPLEARVLELEAELMDARTQLATPRPAASDVARLHQERDAIAARALELERLLLLSEREGQHLRGLTEEFKRRLLERERELESSLTRATALEDRLAEQLADASIRSEALRNVEAELVLSHETHETDVAQLESTLQARGEELRAARAELVRRERLVRELVSQLEDAQRAVPSVVRELTSDETSAKLEVARAELGRLLEEICERDAVIQSLRQTKEIATQEIEAERAKNENLARDAARREAALQTSSWRIAELEKLGNSEDREGPSAKTANVPGPQNKERHRLELELDALRRALTKEHERCESLERQMGAAAEASPAPNALARALALLEQRETLIAQLSAELAGRRPPSLDG